MRGDVPISSKGAVAIRGVVNARYGVNIMGQRKSWSTAGPSQGATAHDIMFAATVNIGNLGRGGRIVAGHGSITISAAAGVNVRGTLYAGGSKHRAGKIDIAAGQDVKIGASARLTAASKPTTDPAATFAYRRHGRPATSTSMGGSPPTARAGRNAGTIAVTSGRDLNVGATAGRSLAPRARAATRTAAASP